MGSWVFEWMIPNSNSHTALNSTCTWPSCVPARLDLQISFSSNCSTPSWHHSLRSDIDSKTLALGILGILSFQSSQAWTPTHHDGSSKAAQHEFWLRGLIPPIVKQDVVVTAHIPYGATPIPSCLLTLLSWTCSPGSGVEDNTIAQTPEPVDWSSYPNLHHLLVATLSKLLNFSRPWFPHYKMLIIGLNKLIYKMLRMVPGMV